MVVMTKQIKAEMNRKFGKYNRRVEKTIAAYELFKVEATERNERAHDKAHNEETKVEQEIEAIYVRFMAIDGATHAEWDEFLGEWADLFGYDNFGAYITAFKPVVPAKTVKSPKPGTVCALVWDIAAANVGLARKAVIELCVAQGVNIATARTQYQRWFTAHKES